MAEISSASVQYNDLKGTAALDFHVGAREDLNGYATDMGIDITRYYPMGLTIYIGELGNFYLKFICIDNLIKDVFKEENNDKIPVVIFEKEEKLQSFLNRVKRFQVVFRAHTPTYEPHIIHKEYYADGTEKE